MSKKVGRARATVSRLLAGNVRSRWEIPGQECSAERVFSTLDQTRRSYLVATGSASELSLAQVSPLDAQGQSAYTPRTSEDVI